MSRAVAWSLVGLSFVLCVLPLTLGKPGLPAMLKSDEPAYYMMAQSLAHDLDLRVEEADVERVFREFPFRPISNLIVMSDDGWRTVHYGKPYVYSLFSAPFVAALGANGMVAFNMLLMVGMIWLGTLYLRRFNPDWVSALFAVGFFLLSAAFPYVFWLHPEVLTMFGVALSLWLAFTPEEGWTPRRRWLLVVVSGIALGIASYNKPMLLALGLPIVGRELLVRRWRRALVWCAAAVVALMAVAGGSMLLTGQPTPYLDTVRQGVTVCEEGVVPIAPGPEGGAVPLDERPTGGAWSWIFRVPDVDWWMLFENSLYFLGGRHTGLLLYFPFALLAVLLFLLGSSEARSRRGWLLLTAVAGIALFFLVFIPRNWQGGGGFVGNRYYVNVYPAFLFLVTAIRPRWTVLATYGWASLFLAPILFTPLGANEPEPTLQSHVRGGPFGLFPLELTLKEIPGYEIVDLGDRRLIGREDQIQPRGGSLWVRGGAAAELVMVGGEETIEEMRWQVRSRATDNRVRIAVDGSEAELGFGAVVDGWETQNVTLEPGDADRVTRIWGASVPVRTVVVDPETGRNVLWTKRFPPPRCPGSSFAHWDEVEENFYVGADVTFLGTDAAGEVLDADVFAVRWRHVKAPREVGVGERFSVDVTVENTSSAVWRRSGSARVNLAYHWFDADGVVVVYDGLRTELPLPVEPGETVAVSMEVEAPPEPGSYSLELDAVFEHVGWFSARGAQAVTVPVDVSS